MATPLVLDRSAVLAFRRRTQALDRRLPLGPASLRRAAWAGLQDSMPRAAVLSIHARVADTPPAVLDDPILVQIWGPRYSTYVVAAEDRGVFTLGRLPDAGPRRRLAEDLAERLAAALGDGWLDEAAAARAIGEPPFRLRYATLTGTIVVRWDGARRPPIRVVPRPATDPAEARRELARRYLHVFGPGTAERFARWAGIDLPAARRTFAELGPALVPVRTPIGDAWLLVEDEPLARSAPEPPAPARLLPSGDAYTLHHDPAERALLVPEAGQRRSLWTSRVWPGAVLVAGEIVGTWRRAGPRVTVEPWRRLGAAERAAVEAEAAAFPLPERRAITIDWVEG